MLGTRLLAALALPVLAMLVLALPASSSSGLKPTLSVMIASPVGGATLRAPTRFSARVRGPRPERVDFYVNGILRHVDRRPPFAYKAGSVRPSELRRGRNTLRVVARRGNTRAEHRITVFATRPSPPPLSGAPGLEQVDGGPGYYGRFSSPFSTAGSYFPIGGWLRPAHNREHFGDYANFGMNVFVGVENPEMANESMIRANGMKSIIQVDERTRFNDLGAETAGWLLFDEIDMVQGPGRGFSTLESLLAGLPGDRRLRFNNYGKGVLEWESDADAARFVNGRNGSNSFQQVVSTDYYWFTDPNARGNPRYGFGSSYGDDVRKIRRLDGLDGVRQPVWHFVELGWPWTEGASQGGRRILPAEIRSAVWHSIIAGARGIIYFDHNFGPAVPGSTILEEGYEDNRVAASQVNAQIRSLAPVLNAPFVTSGHSATDGMAGTVRYTVKWANGKFWLFAGADRGGGDATFSIPCVGTATATVEGESRSVPVNNGSFTDQFADKNAVHIYRIDGGSTCGPT